MAGSVEVRPSSKRARKDGASWAQFYAALAAAIIAIAAGGVSWWQADQSRQQNTVSEQQALVSLVSSIAGDPETLNEESGSFNGNQSALNSAEVGTNFVELTDSEEASFLIKLLNGNGVTAIEYYETALGLEASESDTRAGQLLTDAISQATADSDPRTLANAWEAEASIAFQAGNYKVYSQDLTDARKAFTILGATRAEYNRNLIYLKFFDASYWAGVGDCLVAWNEITDAQDLSVTLKSKLSTADSVIYPEILKDCPAP